jgi:2-oxoglutarate dehydrogenase E1 component
VDARIRMTEGKLPLDWGYAENMAYATLLNQGYPIRISGQDSRRGTFGHRHATYFDQKTGEMYTPLAHLETNQPAFQIYDSLLSEEAVLGFEYGYSKTTPNTLVIWEAQFGDFANGAQVIIDQFISSGWQKWKQLSGLTMLLPHGYEGMGPEHSSARLERYLQLCAQHNMQVCAPTTPAQIFHLLRRQVVRQLRLPLIVMTPKSLLRHKLAISSLEDLAGGQFQLVIPEIDQINPDKVRKVILCSGKVYYDLLTKRREENIEDIAIIRIEQLYPFPYDELQQALAKYTAAKEVVWCQEEPKNQGAWFILRDRLLACLQKGSELTYAGRASSAAPAVGYPALHKKQQSDLVNDAFK